MTGNPGETHVADADSWPAWLDRELCPVEQARVEAHLAACPGCRAAREEWQALHECLAVYAPPPEAPATAEAFWQRLAAQLRPRAAQPDPAPLLTPLALAVGHAIWQGLTVALAALAMLGGWERLAPTWQRLAGAELLSALLRSVAATTWWGAALAEAGSWLSPAIPSDWAGSLRLVAAVTVSWWGFVALAGLYAAWMLLWLRQPSPVRQGT